MRTIKLFRTTKNGRTTVSPIEPSDDYTITYRVIADEYMAITNGSAVRECVDTDTPEEWHDCESADERTDEDALTAKAEAYDILMGGAT
jgi:hypothetical protein